MKLYRRHFLKNFLITLALIPFLKLNHFILGKKNLKLKKKNDFIWFLNEDD